MRIKSVTPKKNPMQPDEYDTFSFGLECLWRYIISNGATIHGPTHDTQNKWAVTWPNKGE